MKSVLRISGFSLTILLLLAVFPLVAVGGQTDDNEQIPLDECIEQEVECEEIPEEETNTDGRIPKGEVSQETVAGTNEPESEPQVLAATTEPEVLAETGQSTELLSIATGLTVLIVSLSLSRKSSKYHI